MILISFTIALIAIIFGAKLLAQAQKENLNSLYKYISWFVIVMGLLVLLCDGGRAMLRCCHRGEGRMMRKECMVNDGGCMMFNHCNRGNMCNENNCCVGNKCSDGMMNCPDAKGSMNSSCPMMNMKCKGDSGKSGK